MANNNDNHEEWSCKYCTYINVENDCCEICGESKDNNNKKKFSNTYVNDDNNNKKQKSIDLTKSNNIKDEVTYINLNSLNIIGSQDNLMTNILNSVKDSKHLEEINEMIQKCYQNTSYNLDDVNVLAEKLKDKGVLTNNKMNIFAFSLYWPAFLAALNSSNSKRKATFEKVCCGHWSFWIREAGDPKRKSDHWKIIRNTMIDYGILLGI